MKSQTLTLQGIAIRLRKIECTPGENKVRSTIFSKDAVFSITINGAELINGEVPANVLPMLKDHIALYFSPMTARGRKNSYYAND
jgi:hypothetical protein